MSIKSSLSIYYLIMNGEPNYTRDVNTNPKTHEGIFKIDDRMIPENDRKDESSENIINPVENGRYIEKIYNQFLEAYSRRRPRKNIKEYIDNFNLEKNSTDIIEDFSQLKTEADHLFKQLMIELFFDENLKNTYIIKLQKNEDLIKRQEKTLNDMNKKKNNNDLRDKIEENIHGSILGGTKLKTENSNKQDIEVKFIKKICERFLKERFKSGF